MAGIDLRHQERHVRLHPVVFGVGNDRQAGSGEGALNRARHRRVEPAENEVARREGLRHARLHGHVGHALRHRRAREPVRGLTVRLPGGALRRSQRGDLEPGMIREEANEGLPDGASSAQDACAKMHSVGSRSFQKGRGTARCALTPAPAWLRLLPARLPGGCACPRLPAGSCSGCARGCPLPEAGATPSGASPGRLRR